MACKVRKLYFFNFTFRMIKTLYFSKMFGANETIADNILTGQEKSLPPEQENWQFWKPIFFCGDFFLK